MKQVRTSRNRWNERWWWKVGQCPSTAMNSISSGLLYNCSAMVLDCDVEWLRGLNRSELLNVLEEALDRSIHRETLRIALSECLFSGQQRPFDLPWWQKLTWYLVYAIIFFVSTGGNIIVMWIVLGQLSL